MSTLHLGMLKKGQLATIVGLNDSCRADIRQRLLDLGFVPGTEIQIENISPLNDPVAYSIYNTQISLRHNDACCILIRLNESSAQ